MSPEQGPNRPSVDEQIQQKQHDLDASDGRIDTKIAGATPEEQEKLTETYMTKLNLLQGRIRELRTTAEIQRNARASHWQELAETCGSVEQQLLILLSSVDIGNANARVDELGSEIDGFLQKVAGAEFAHQPEGEMKENQQQHPPDELLLRREELQDTLTRLREEYGNVCTAERNDLKGLERYVRDENDENQKRLLNIIADHRKRKEDIQTKMQSPAREIIALDIAITRLRERDARSAGRTDDADRSLLKLLEQYGNDLEKLDSQAYADAIHAKQSLEERGTLSAFEKDLFTQGKEREALSESLSALREVQSSADILDQVQARETFVVESVAKGSEYWKHAIPQREGRKQDHLKNSYVTTLNVRGGQKLTVVLTPAAKQALERIPDGAQPVLLKPVQSMQTKTIGSGRGSRVEFANPASDYTLDAYHIGYVKDGEVSRSGVGKIDLATHDHKQDVERQLRNQRGFSVEEYKAPCDLRKDMKERYPFRLLTIKTQSGHTIEGVTITTDATALIAKDPPEGYTLVLKRIPKAVTLSTEYTEQSGRYNVKRFRRVLDVDMIRKDDLGYAKIENGDLVTTSIDGKQTERQNTKAVEKEQAEKGHDVLRALDRDLTLQKVSQDAQFILGPLQHLQGLLSAGMEADKYGTFVAFARNEARPLYDRLKSSDTLANLEQARQRLRELKDTNLGVALGGIETEIDQRIKVLDDFAKVFENDQITHLLSTILDKSKFDEDTWGDFFYELAKVVAVIAAAVAITVLATTTFGAGLVVAAAIGAATGVALNEGVKEIEFYANQYLDADVRSGKLMYTERSQLGKWAEGQKIFNSETGKYEDMDFLKDVASPYAKDFLWQFAMCLAAGGAAAVAGKLSLLAQNTTFVQGLAQNSKLANRVLQWMQKIGEHGGDDSFKQAFKKELGDELGDELIKEKGAEGLLTRIDPKLGMFAAIVVGAGKGVRVGRGSHDLTYSDRAQAEQWVQGEGGTITATQPDGRMTVEIRGQEVILTPETKESSLVINKVDSNLYAARNRLNLSAEQTQQAAIEIVDTTRELAEKVRSGDPDATKRYIEGMGQQKVQKLMEKANDKRANMKPPQPPFETHETFVQQELAPTFLIVVANIEAGKIGLGEGENYIGEKIRKLHNLAPYADMAVMLEYAQKLHSEAMQQNAQWRAYAAETHGIDPDSFRDYINWLVSPDQTIKGGRPDLPKLTLAQNESVQLNAENTNTRLNDQIGKLAKFGAEHAGVPFTSEKYLEALSGIESEVDRQILEKTAAMLENMESTQGPNTLKDSDRYVILEYSARFLQEYRAANFGKNTTSQELFEHVARNATNLAHQNIMDYMTLVGSSHGTLHVLRGNSGMLLSLFDELNFTPEERVLALQSTFDHDMGYTKRTLVGKTVGEGAFDIANDHPLEGALYVRAMKEEYQKLFGKSYDEYHPLDHSDPLGGGQFGFDSEGNPISKLAILVDPNADPRLRSAAAVACVDCLATVSNLKGSPLFRDNPQIQASLSRIAQLYVEIRENRQQGTGPTKKEILAEIENIQRSMQERIGQMRDSGALNALEATAYLTALKATMQFKYSDFTPYQYVAMLAASVSPKLEVQKGKVCATYTVDAAGMSLIRETVGQENAADFGAQQINKAADDFGGFSAENAKTLKTYMHHAANLRGAPGSSERSEAIAYFRALPNAGIDLPTQSTPPLVIRLRMGQNPEYKRISDSVEANLRINKLRDFARANVDAIIRGEPLTVRDVDNVPVTIVSPEAYVANAQESVSRIVKSLPAGFVMQNAEGTGYVSVHEEAQRIVAETNGMETVQAIKTWQEFCGRMYRSGGSAEPIARQEPLPKAA